MYFYDRAVLPIIDLDDPAAGLDWETIRDALCAHPCNIVMVECNGVLVGIVSQGDMIRAREANTDTVQVNTAFTRLHGKRFMEAREIFRDRKNIHELPVVDEAGKLIGMCSRYDDVLYLEYSNPWKGNKYAARHMKGIDRAFFVRPPAGDERREAVIRKWMQQFQNFSIQCDLIDFENIPDAAKEGRPILITDEEQNLAVHIVFEVIDGATYPWTTLCTCKTFEERMAEHAYDDLIQKLAASGISIYNLIFTADESTPGRKRLSKGFRDWLVRPGAREVAPFVPSQQAEAFYCELYSEPYAETVGRYTIELEKSDIYTRLKDCEGPYFNVVNGERVTKDQPEDAPHTIYFFGPCVMIGAYVEDQHTIESFLQKRLNEAGYNYKVVNCGCYETRYQEMIHITSTPMKPGDIVVMHLDNHVYPDTTTIDLTSVLDKHDVPNDWLLDIPLHCNH